MELPAEFRETYFELLRLIIKGVIVAYVSGPVVNGTHYPTIIVSVESGDTSLGAAATRREAFLRSMSPPGSTHQIDDRSEISLPVGDAIRITAHSDPAGGIPSQTIEYVLLIDELTVSVFGTAPAAYTEFGDVMAGVAEDLRRSWRSRSRPSIR